MGSPVSTDAPAWQWKLQSLYLQWWQLLPLSRGQDASQQTVTNILVRSHKLTSLSVVIYSHIAKTLHNLTCGVADEEKPWRSKALAAAWQSGWSFTKLCCGILRAAFRVLAKRRIIKCAPKRTAFGVLAKQLTVKCAHLGKVVEASPNNCAVY